MVFWMVMRSVFMCVVVESYVYYSINVTFHRRKQEFGTGCTFANLHENVLCSSQNKRSGKLNKHGWRETYSLLYKGELHGEKSPVG